MAEIKAIYEEHKHRYGYRRITAELRRRGLLVNQCLARVTATIMHRAKPSST